MSRTVSMKKVILLVSIFLLAALCFAAFLATDQPAEAKSITEDLTIANGGELVCTEDTIVQNGATLTVFGSLKLDAASSLTIAQGAYASFEGVDVDFTMLKGEIIVYGTLEFIECNWTATEHNINITVEDGGVLNLKNAVIRDNYEESATPITVNGGSVNITEHGSGMVSQVCSLGNYAIVVNSGSVYLANDNSLMKRAISTTEDGASDFQSYKKVVYLAKDAHFIAGEYDLTNAYYNLYLTGFDVENYYCRIKSITTEFLQTDFDARRIDNDNSEIFSPSARVDLSIANNDGADGTKVYNGQAMVLTATIINPADGVTYTYKWYREEEGAFSEIIGETGSSLSLTNVADSDNYQCAIYNGETLIAESSVVTASITPITATLSWSDTEFTYNGAAQAPTATVSNLVDGDTCTVTVGGGQIDAGTYTAEATSFDNDNYELPEGTTTEFTIAPLTATLSWANTALTYNGSAQAPTATVSNLVDGDTCTVTVDGGQIDAGTYTAEATSFDNDNYELPEGTTTEFTIAPLTATLSWSTLSLIYNGMEQAPTAKVTNLVGEDECTVTVSGSQIDADFHFAMITALGNSNYALPDTTTITTTYFRIKPLTATLIWTNTELTYNGTAQAPTATVTNLIGSDACSVTVSGGETDADTYTATATALSNSNYELPAANTTNYTIAPKTATLSWANTALTYNGTVQAPTATVSNLESGDTCTVTVSGGETDAGTYTATATTLSNSNYKLPDTGINVSFTITASAISNFEIAEAYSYNGTYQRVRVVCTDIPSGNEYSVFLEGDTTVKDAGTYSVTVTGLYSPNYVMNVAGPTLTFTVLPRSITYTIADTNFSVYGDPILADENLKGSVTSEFKEITPDEAGITLSVGALSQGDDAGYYNISGDWSNKQNYIVAFENTEDAYQIKPRVTEISFVGEREFVYNDGRHYIDVIASNLYGDDSILFTYENASTGLEYSIYNQVNAFKANNYQITFTAVDNNPNYILAQEETLTFVIHKRELGLEISGSEGLVYNREAKTILATPADACFFAPTSFTTQLHYNGLEIAEAVNAGVYTLTVTGFDTPDGTHENYTLPEEGLTATFEIAKAPVGIAFDGYNGLVFNGNEYTVTATATAVYAGDTVNLTIEGNTATDAGNYTAVVKSLDNANYILPATGYSLDYTIQKSPVTVAIGSATSVYGDPFAPLTYTTTGFIAAGDELNFTLSKDEGYEVGFYDISGSDYNNPNYDITFTGEQDAYQITPRAISYTIATLSSVYGEALAPLTYTATGTVADGDDLHITLTKEEGEDVGFYDITGSADNNPNYDITFTGGQNAYQITPRAISYNIATSSSVYGEALAPLTYTATGTVADGDDLHINLTKEEGEDVGFYDITGSADNNPNYDITFTGEQDAYQITPRAISCNIDSRSSVYGDAFALLTYTIIGTVVDEDDLHITLTKEEGYEIGIYNIIGSSNNNNYEVAFLNGQNAYTIHKKLLTVTFDGYSDLVYNGEAKNITVTLDGVVEGDIVQLNVMGNGHIDAGNYMIGVIGFDTEEGDDYRNYLLPTDLTQAYQIAPKEIGIEFLGATDSVYNGTTANTSALPTGYIAGDNISLIYTIYRTDCADTIVTEVKDAGSYQITVTEIAGEKKANYVLPQEGSEESFTISPAEVDYIIADVYSVYGDPVPTLYGSVQNPASVYAEDTLDIVLQTSGIDVGSYPVTGVAGNPNYTVSFYQGTYTIVKRSVELEFSGYDNDGEPREYKHSNFNIFIQATNLVAGDDVRYNPAALTLTKNGLVKNVIRAASYYISVEDDAGNYELTVTGITGEDCDNYDFGGSTLLYTVSPRTLTLTFEGCTNLVYNGNQHIVTAVPGNLVVGDEVLLTYEGASYTNAGTYTVEVTGVNNPNYILPAYTSRIYVISKARPTVSVAATKFEYPYDEHKNYSIEAAASNGEPVQYYLVSGNTLLPTHNSFGSNVGIFTIMLTTEENANYLSAEPVEIMIVILETSFSNSIGGQETTVSLANGANPNAGFVNRLAEHQENAVTRYAPVFRDKIVSYVYEAKLMENNIPVDNTGRATITFQLPSTHENLDEATVMFYENGGYVYETVAVNNGTITFTMEELGEFALLGDKDLSPRIIESANYKMTFMVLGVLGAIALTVLLISWFAVIRKTKQSHII